MALSPTEHESDGVLSEKKLELDEKERKTEDSEEGRGRRKREGPPLAALLPYGATWNEALKSESMREPGGTECGDIEGCSGSVDASEIGSGGSISWGRAPDAVPPSPALGYRMLLQALAKRRQDALEGPFFLVAACDLPLVAASAMGVAVAHSASSAISPEMLESSEEDVPDPTVHVRVYCNEAGVEVVAVVAGPKVLEKVDREEGDKVVDGDGSPVMVRVHDACFTSEVLGSAKCDCREQLQASLLRARREGAAGRRAVVLYLPQEGRGIGLAAKVAAYNLQSAGRDTVDANRDLGLPDDTRAYDAVADVLQDLDIRSIALLTNNPRKAALVDAAGRARGTFQVHRTVPLHVVPHGLPARDYLRTKASRMGHQLDQTLL